MPTIEHFEIPADDVERARRFYQDLFGWQIEKFPGDMEYWGIHTTAGDGGKGLGGGMLQRMHPQHSIANYVGVENIEAMMKKVEQLGGQIIVPKTPVPKMGWFCFFTDTERNVMAMWQMDPKAG